jgi:hypothetical protein
MHFIILHFELGSYNVIGCYCTINIVSIFINISSRSYLHFINDELQTEINIDNFTFFSNRMSTIHSSILVKMILNPRTKIVNAVHGKLLLNTVYITNPRHAQKLKLISLVSITAKENT